MFYYNQLCNDIEINLMLDNLNNLLNMYYDNSFVACHGRYHAMFTVDMVEHILKSLSFDERTIEIGKIAALLHDIGNVAGRKRHDKKSAALASVIFEGSDYLTSDEKQLIYHAIADHSAGRNIESAVGAALVIADKVDFAMKRAVDYHTKSESEKDDESIKHVELIVTETDIVIYAETGNKFDKELFDNGFNKRYGVIKRAAAFLGCSCAFQFSALNEKFAL